MELKPTTRRMLCDEAYAFLCRSALEQALAEQEKAAATLLEHRPAFGILASRQKREAFAHSLQQANQLDAVLRERLDLVHRIENWLRRHLHRDLMEYLETESTDFHLLAELEGLQSRWESQLAAMPDLLAQFGRSLRTVKAQAMAPSVDQRTLNREVSALRDLALRIEDQQAPLDEVARRISDLALQIGAQEVRTPVIPAFRRTVWVDWLGAIPLEQAITEVTRVEFEVRSFLNSGLQAARAKLQAARAWSVLTRENLLTEYWEQLRTHARTHHVRDCEVDEALAELSQRYESALEDTAAPTTSPAAARADVSVVA